MSHFFQFEADFVESLRCIPMQVRYKLDSCGVKLKLHHWNQFTPEEKQQLVEAPCETPEEVQRYRSHLHHYVDQHGSDRPADLPIPAQPAWMNGMAIPETVQVTARSLNCNLSLTDWRGLTPLQRFALIKLSQSSHEHRNFLPALQEFGLYPKTPLIPSIQDQ